MGGSTEHTYGIRASGPNGRTPIGREGIRVGWFRRNWNFEREFSPFKASSETQWTARLTLETVLPLYSCYAAIGRANAPAAVGAPATTVSIVLLNPIAPSLTCTCWHVLVVHRFR